jgi:hypothetical protein
MVHPDAAGIDVGGSENWVAVSPERDRRRASPWWICAPVVEKGVRSVALEATVYWMPVFEVLEQHGLEVFLVKCAAHQERAWVQKRRAAM